MEVRAEEVKVEILHPAYGFEPVATRLEVRWDPLTNQTARVLPPSGLMPPQRYDLAALADESRADCPFCSERIEAAVPRFPGGILPKGRIQVGEAILFPNLLPYSQYSSVSVYSPERHFLTLGQLTPRLVADNLAAQVAFDRAVLAADPGALWASVNANHMLPSGSSVFHPHLQGGVHPTPTNQQRFLAAVPGERYTDYLATERRLGRRWLGELGGITWLAGFAPLGPGDIRGFIPGAASPAQLAPDQVEALGVGISRALGLYADLGFESFNMALYGAPRAHLAICSTCAWSAAPIWNPSTAQRWPGWTRCTGNPPSTSPPRSWPTGPQTGSADERNLHPAQAQPLATELLRASGGSQRSFLASPAAGSPAVG